MRLCDLLRPLMRVFPRQSIHLLGYLGAGWDHDAKWRNVRPRYRSYFDRDLQCIVSEDLAEWGGRSCYYWGRFFDITHQAVLRRYLAPGDTYIDIGANVGYHSLYAARLAGERGQVLSFEPNPDTYSILSAHVAINRIRNCRTFQMALGDAVGEAVLNQPGAHSGTSTLMPISGGTLKSITIPVQKGDAALQGIPFVGKVFIKIDVEGFEQRVLEGLRETLNKAAVVAVEVTPEWIERVGGSAEELYRYMREAGFRAFIPEVRWRLMFLGSSLELREAEGIIGGQHDVLFVR
jgi:FkbM family methyltransferase